MRIDGVAASAYRFPTEQPEADGTLHWDATTAVVVQVHAESMTGLGWTYSTAAAADLVDQMLAPALVGHHVDDVSGAFELMRRTCRNLGTRGLVMQAISAVDIALWDLKARAHGLPIGALLGRVRQAVPIYGSGGFTTMTDDELHAQLDEWLRIGCRAVKIKIGEEWGTRVSRDLERVHLVREHLDAHARTDVAVMVDANGGYSRGQARRIGAVLDELGVSWFEEPVSSDDVEGLALLRDVLHCDVAAGEYLSDDHDAARLCGSVDCLQLDATRCGGYTGFLRGAAIAAAHDLQVSAHCAPAVHAPVAGAVPNLRHVEYFADHARLEPLLISGTPLVSDGLLEPGELHSGNCVGNGYALSAGAQRWQIAGRSATSDRKSDRKSE